MDTITRDDVRKICNDLIASKGTTTTREVKEELRNRGFIAFQSEVANYMYEIEETDKIPWTFNGIYRTYGVGGPAGKSDDDDVVATKAPSVVVTVPDGDGGVKPATLPPVLATPSTPSVDADDEEDKSSMGSGEVRFHMEEDGSFGSLKFKTPLTKGLKGIEIKISDIGTPTAAGTYSFTYAAK